MMKVTVLFVITVGLFTPETWCGKIPAKMDTTWVGGTVLGSKPKGQPDAWTVDDKKDVVKVPVKTSDDGDVSKVTNVGGYDSDTSPSKIIPYTSLAGGPVWPKPLPPKPKVPQPYTKPITHFEKFFPESVKKPHKTLPKHIDDRWKEWALNNPIPVRRPIYPPVYVQPTDAPPFLHQTEKPIHKPETEKPYYVEPTTQQPHYVEPITQEPEPHYTAGPTTKPHVGLPDLPLKVPTLYQLLEALDFRRFLHLIDESGLKEYINGLGPVTIFVPTNKAFERLPYRFVKKLAEDREFLKKVLEYHIVSGVSQSIGGQSQNYFKMTSVSGHVLNVNIYNSVSVVNGLVILKPDLTGSNGVAHIMNDVMYPFLIKNLLEVLQDEGDKFSILKTALQTAGLNDDYLVSGGPYTFFAPSDKAFHKLDKKTLDWILNNPKKLRSVLLSCFVSGTYYTYGFGETTTLTSVEGTTLQIGKDIEYFTVNGHQIVKSDISATNGVVHVVDDLLTKIIVLNLYETIKSIGPSTTLFIEALEKAGLVDEHLLAGGPYTIFVPSNEVLSKVDSTTYKWLLANPLTLKELLLNHFVAGTYHSDSLTNGLVLTAVSGSKLNIENTGSYINVNGKPITKADILASNGVVHVLSNILFEFKVQDLSETLKGDGRFTIFLTLLQKAGLTYEYFKNLGPFTLFVPTDKYFNTKFSALHLQWLLKNPEKLKGLILNHFVSGVYYSDSLKGQTELTTLNNGYKLNVGVKGEYITINDYPIVNADIHVANGVIHVLDGILFSVKMDNLLDTLKKHGYKTFVEGLVNSGLVKDADNYFTNTGGTFTIFVPTEAAFNKIEKTTLHWLLWDPTNLKALISKHIVSGVHYYDGLKHGSSISTIGNGAQLEIGEYQGKKTVNGVTISKYDVLAENGIIHAIDTVLFSEGLKKPSK